MCQKEVCTRNKMLPSLAQQRHRYNYSLLHRLIDNVQLKRDESKPDEGGGGQTEREIDGGE